MPRQRRLIEGKNDFEREHDPRRRFRMAGFPLTDRCARVVGVPDSVYKPGKLTLCEVQPLASRPELKAERGPFVKFGDGSYSHMTHVLPDMAAGQPNPDPMTNHTVGTTVR